VEELAVGQRTLATQPESKYERERERGCVFVCVLPASRRYGEGEEAGAGGWLCIYINT